jgi:hypothetical protein
VRHAAYPACLHDEDLESPPCLTAFLLDRIAMYSGPQPSKSFHRTAGTMSLTMPPPPLSFPLALAPPLMESASPRLPCTHQVCASRDLLQLPILLRPTCQADSLSPNRRRLLSASSRTITRLLSLRSAVGPPHPFSSTLTNAQFLRSTAATGRSAFHSSTRAMAPATQEFFSSKKFAIAGASKDPSKYGVSRRNEGGAARRAARY